MDESNAAHRVARRLVWQGNRFLVSQRDFYDERMEYWRHVGRRYRRFWIDLYRGRPWLELLLYLTAVLVIILVLYLYWLNIEPPERVPAQSAKPGLGLQMLAACAVAFLWLPVSYWFLRYLQYSSFELKYKSGKNTGRIETQSPKDQFLYWFSCSLFCVVIACALILVFVLSNTPCWSLVSLAQSIGILYVWFWLTARVGDIVFTDWNRSSGDSKVTQWNYGRFACFVAVNLLALMLVGPFVESGRFPHFSSIPVSGWLMHWALKGAQGNWWPSLLVLLTLLLSISVNLVLKRYMSSFAYRRKRQTKKKVFDRNDISITQAVLVSVAENEKISGQSAEVIADDLRTRLERGPIRRCWARMTWQYVVGLTVISAFPVALVLLMHQTIGGVPVEHRSGFHLRIAGMWCVPVCVCGVLLHLMSSKYFRVRRFGRSPVSLGRWWKMQLFHTVVTLVAVFCVCVPCIATLGCLYGFAFPWMVFLSAVGYLGLVVVCISMVVASLLAVAHLWCLLPKWRLWLEHDLCVPVLLLTSIVLLFSGAFITEEFELRASRFLIGVAMAVPPLVTVGTMAYVYTLTEKQGGDPRASKKGAGM